MKLVAHMTNKTVPEINLQIDPIGIFLLFLCLFTIFGNLLIIYAIIRDERLHTPKYYYIGSLAFADFLVGLIVMPLAFIFEMTDDEYWLFPHHLRKVCDFWHSMDIFASTASIFGLSAIGIDRYVAITRPMEYLNSFSSKYWFYHLSFIWIFSAAISFPAVIHLGTEKRTSERESLPFIYKECEFPDNPFYMLFTSITTFFIPLMIMIYVYVKVYTAAKKQAAALRSGFKHHHHIMASSTSFFCGCCSRDDVDSSMNNGISSPQPITLRIHCGQYQNPNLQATDDENGSGRKKTFWRTMSNDQKARTFVGLVMGVFVICWFPYFIYFLLIGVFGIRVENKQHDEILFRFLSWLGYTNSALDILVYIFTSKELRAKFSKLFSRRTTTTTVVDE